MSHTTYRPFESLLAEVRREGVTRWSEIESAFLGVVSRFDGAYASGRRTGGWYRAKARYFNDLIVLLLSNRTGRALAARTHRRSLLFGEADVDLCYDLDGIPVAAGEVKALGTPPHPGNQQQQRDARSDLHKRVREVAFTAMDLKAAYTEPMPITSFADWVKRARPAYFSFWALRVSSDADAQTCQSLLSGLKGYCNEVGAVFYGPGRSATDYQVRRWPGLSLDRALLEFAQRIEAAR